MAYTITVPEITAVTVSPASVAAGAKYSVSATVREKTIVLEPVWPYSGQIFSGQTTIFLGGNAWQSKQYNLR